MQLFKRESRQRTFCYCPICKTELCGATKDDTSFVSDTNKGVTYECRVCTCRSLWNFDIAPFPVLVAHQMFTGKMVYLRFRKG